MNRYLVSFLVFTTLLFSQENLVNTQETIDINQSYDPNVDCLILEDENSIICKFEVIRDTEKEQVITINWVSPTGEISRSREMIIPPGDSSAYDYRYLDGREGGKWDFMIIYNGKEYSSKFELKN
ncbi:hypothetical protein [Arcobacter aquimarinus]|uniref:Uncharacterized protein n=1 Tax=Arcobacter aquimarinus TaxID=1315211 RepID=A0AAE7B385_9BACT|nr:hypothetical protein [Arcobacter aquimarinus]QKE26673.1 hypothetical protein AAQM_1938 [Arcobacter aquimarinus]RXI33628.1 hypothetical protein CP986_10050 [Arcobacter aquimarinus]